ncbi:MAG TPA: UDP-glucose/GDP-mannose dehydrogenase family protein [Verrucomicrobiae bacterium]|nr:UDP-glucose/GDP-mannose dehydrogenase family protein [Verrucomicrobiae bacterium]
MKVAVIGTGYVGLVSGACLAEIGHAVTCVDVDPAKIDRLRRGEMPIYEPGLADVIKRNAAVGRLRFTTSYAEAVPGAEVVSIGVGTPSAEDGSADLRYVFAAAEEIAKHLTTYAVVVDKSTVPVGTSEAVADRIRKNGVLDFDVVSNPETLREGRAVSDFLHPDRIIIGTSSERAAQVMLDLYKPILCQKLVMNPRSAELAKYAANAFLATKISFINEIAHLAEDLGADVQDVAAAIGSDARIGPHFLKAGLGWGGSCFPKDVKAIRHVGHGVGHEMPLVSAAMAMNERARSRPIERLSAALGGLKGKRIGLLGLAFKNDTDDTRESAAIDLAKRFLAAGAQVRAYDPAAVVHDQEVSNMVLRVSSIEDAAKNMDALVIATEWDHFKKLDLPKLKSLMAGTVIFDGRNLLDPETVRKHGFTYLSVGRA